MGVSMSLYLYDDAQTGDMTKLANFLSIDSSRQGEVGVLCGK
jgi:hypothetical protein